MTACLFGTYVRGHSANRLLREALVEAGWRVEELHVALWEATTHKGARYFAARSLARLGREWARAAVTLVRRWRARGERAPLVVIGFGGQLDVLLAWWLCRPRAGLVFAPLVSLTETLVEDRRVLPAESLRARAVALLDRASLRAADLVLADTAAHAAYLARLGVPAERIGVWHLGAEPEFFEHVPTPVTGRRVLFYGRHLPLHGVDTIVAAAARLGAAAEMVIIGDGPERRRAQALATRTGARLTWRDEVPLTALPAELAQAAVVLGVFGVGPKAEMVVPNKVYQAAAAGRPLVTRDSPALEEVLRPGEHCLTCPPGDPEALAEAITRLLDDPALGARLGRAARAHVLDQFGAARQAERLGRLLADRLGVAASGTRRAPEPAPAA